MQSADPKGEPGGQKVALAVAPLTLVGIGEACYDVRVMNGAGATGDVVWSAGNPFNGAAASVALATGEGAICSGQYGNGPGGDIAYVGPCDAGTPISNPNHTHTVTVWIENLFATGGSPLVPSEWTNPCADGGAGCSLEFDCEENKDVEVTFNFTVLRSADQGFFDVAVNFENIFCSAKLDCSIDTDNPGVVDPGEEIKLLFNMDGDRDTTAVLAFACTAGPSANDTTTLYTNDVRVRCDGDAMAVADPVTAGTTAMACNAQNQVYGVGIGILQAAAAGFPIGATAMTSIKYVPDTAYPSGFEPQPLNLPATNVPGANGTQFQAVVPTTYVGSVDANKNPYVVSLYITEFNAFTQGAPFGVISGVHVGLARVAANGDLVHKAVFQNPAGLMGVFDIQLLGGGTATDNWIVGTASMGGHGNEVPNVPPIAINLAPALVQLDATGAITDDSVLTSAKLGNLGAALGQCKADVGMGPLLGGTCPNGVTATGRSVVVWDLSDGPTDGVYPAHELPARTLPNLGAGLVFDGVPAELANMGGEPLEAGGVVTVDESGQMLVTQHVYAHRATVNSPWELAQTVEVYHLDATHTTWENAAHEHLNLGVGASVAWDDGVSRIYGPNLTGYFDVQTANGVNRQNLIINLKSDGSKVVFDSYTNGTNTMPLTGVNGLFEAGGRLYTYGSTETQGQLGAEITLLALPETMPSAQSGVEPLVVAATTHFPAGQSGAGYYIEGVLKQLVDVNGSTQERLTMVARSSNNFNSGMNAAYSIDPRYITTWSIATSGSTIVAGNPMISRTQDGSDLDMNASGRNNDPDTYGEYPSNNGDAMYSIRLTAPTSAWEVQAQRCGFLMMDGQSQTKTAQASPSPAGQGQEAAQNQTKSQGFESVSYVFKPSADPAAPSQILGANPLQLPSWYKPNDPAIGLRSMATASGPNGESYSLLYAAGTERETILTGMAYPGGTALTQTGTYSAFAIAGFAGVNGQGVPVGLGIQFAQSGSPRYPFWKVAPAIVTTATNGSLPTVVESLDGPWDIGYPIMLDRASGAILVTDQVNFGNKGSSLDPLQVAHDAVFNTNSGWYTNFGNFASGYLQSANGNGYKNSAVILGHPNCDETQGSEDGYACVTIGFYNHYALGQCSASRLCAPDVGYYVWDYNTTSARAEPVRLDLPADSALDPNLAVGETLVLEPQGANGGALTNIGDTSAFLTTVPYTITTQQGPTRWATATVLWSLGANSQWTSEVVMPGAAFGNSDFGIQGSYVVGNLALTLVDPNSSDATRRVMVARQPTTLTGAWDHWDTLVIDGNYTATNFNFTALSEDRGLVLGMYTDGNLKWVPFVAQLVSGTNHTLFARSLANAAPGCDPGSWSDLFFRRVALGNSPQDQPMTTCTANGDGRIVVINVPSGALGTWQVTSASGYLVAPPVIAGYANNGFKDVGSGDNLGIGTMDFGPLDASAVLFNFATQSSVVRNLEGGSAVFAARAVLTKTAAEGINIAEALPLPAEVAVPVLLDGGTILPQGLDGKPMAGNGWTSDPNAEDSVYQYAIYKGDEQLNCGGMSCNKRYFNVAIGFDPTKPNCVAYWDATAAPAGRFTDGVPPANTQWPIIHYEVKLTNTLVNKDTGVTTTTVCGQNPVGEIGSGVQPVYTNPGKYDPNLEFCYAYGPGNKTDGSITDFCGGIHDYTADGQHSVAVDYGGQAKK